MLIAPLTAPIPAEWSVEDGRNAYLAENGFRLQDYDAPRTPASFLGVKFSVPNTASHRRAIMQHDLHHVATGFGTDPAGEGEISAWEARGGLKQLGLYVGAIVLFGILLGVVFAPRRTLVAWRSARGSRPLFGLTEGEYRPLLALSVGELRERLGVPKHGLAQQPRQLHSTAPG
jgi:hypothetical protein